MSEDNKKHRLISKFEKLEEAEDLKDLLSQYVSGDYKPDEDGNYIVGEKYKLDKETFDYFVYDNFKLKQRESAE